MGRRFSGNGGTGTPRALSVIVPLQTGAIYTIPRLLGSTSTFALLDGTAATARGLSAGTNANLTLTGGNQISATAALTAGASQAAAVEERSADGSAAVARIATLTGQITPPPSGSAFLAGRDGQQLIGQDGQYLYGVA